MSWVASDSKASGEYWELCVDVNNKGMQLDLNLLSTLERLKALRIFGGTIERSSLKVLARLPQLHLFVVTEFELQNDDLRSFRGCRRLAKLDIGGREISAAGLKHLVGVRSLRRLFLYNTAIRDADLAPLQGMTFLEQVVLPKTISDTALSALITALPKARVSQL